MAELAKRPANIATIIVEEKLTPPWKEALQSFGKNKLAVAGLGIVLLYYYSYFGSCHCTI